MENGNKNGNAFIFDSINLIFLRTVINIFSDLTPIQNLRWHGYDESVKRKIMKKKHQYRQ